jgi:hypothetical protein
MYLMGLSSNTMTHLAQICELKKSSFKGEGTPKKLATAFSENCYQPQLNTLLNGAAYIEETAQ